MRCETQTIEVKAAAQGAPRIYDTLSSFSNQEEGGAIVFGIDEKNGFELCGDYDALMRLCPAAQYRRTIVEEFSAQRSSRHVALICL